MLGHKCPFVVASRLGSRQRAGSGSSAGGSASGLGPEGRRFESCLPDVKHTSCTAKKGQANLEVTLAFFISETCLAEPRRYF